MPFLSPNQQCQSTEGKKSDHNCILVKRKCYYAYNKAVSRVVTKQYLSEQVLDNLAYVINGIPWQVMYSMNDGREQADFFL